jgi:hypothetical protein
MQNNKKTTEPTVEEMTEALTQYYEAAGFANYYNRVLKGKNDEEIRQMYMEMDREE